MADVALPPPSRRDADVQAAVLPLIEGYQWREAVAILRARIKEINDRQDRQIDRIFRAWSALPEAEREEFLTYAHHRRQGVIGDE